VRLYTRNGHDFTARFPLIVAAIAALPARSCLIDGEVIVSDDSGLAVFELIRPGATATLRALRLRLTRAHGQDLRRLPIEVRKARLAQLLRCPHPGIALNTRYVGDGDIVYRQACQLGCERIVSKRCGHSIAPADPSIGSRSRTRRPRQCGARPRQARDENCPAVPSSGAQRLFDG
jgi:bifunctional non-homologous end joining protein LigD